jgi:uncharacterized protein (TIGR03663 family)
MMPRRGTALSSLAIVLLAAGALVFRVPRLAERPMHCDEANQAFKAGWLFDRFEYQYDPHEYHGPTLYWLTLPSLWLSADSYAESDEFDYRIVAVAFGVGLVLLLLLLVAADGLGRGAALGAGVFTAISPAMVFYSRYYIQETLLVFFTFGAIACGWRYVRGRAWGLAAAAGAFVGLMFATKETWILAAAAAAIGVALAMAWIRLHEGAWPALGPVLRPGPAAAALGAACLVAGLFYSSFGTHWQGIADSVAAYATYFRRGTEVGDHTHPWHFYLQRLAFYRPARGFFWSEGLILGLAAVGFLGSLVRRAHGGEDLREGDENLVRFLGFYTLALVVIYSAIPYKTPWCMLSFLHGMILLAGVGAWRLMRWAPHGLLRALKWLLVLALGAGAIQLAWQSYRLNYVFSTDQQRNPHVYAHTSRNVLDLARFIENLAAVSPDGHRMVIHVVTAENFWPLPWYLRRFDPDRVGYWSDPAAWARQTRDGPDPSILILTDEAQDVVDAGLRVPYSKGKTYNIRPTNVERRGQNGHPGGTLIFSVYVREDLWNRFTEAAR